ncbi:enoyl-CoA hydratase/isomerase family protein [Parapedobacter sp. ISTM3]|uniref:enoyl-CoA hydratase/isomerase family protein n=1 Tax=Parapedobacter sp. ISTM3 TaxID=2800130 RepID=UPI0019083D16|nr:enoyl-CoA hydratase-related protein [Parapedobacter sp. ISTM3]MBK1442467.1 enoyl-CoA hydratase/isomerase family protein [Parapedobacter sp. ISTM3]
MKYQNLLVHDESQIRHIVINRVEKLNALNKPTLAALHEAVKDALAEPNVRGIILTGAGEKAFVAGADIVEFATFNAVQGRELAQEGQTNVFDIIHHASKPIVAAINGYALGGGLELALACHIRLATTYAKLGLPEVSLGLIPGYGGTQRLTQLVGRGKAMEIILTGDMISADEALRAGLVNYVVEPADLLPKATHMLQRIASRSPNAIAAAIRAVNAGLAQHGFETEIKEFGKCFDTPDFKEGVSAFLEKRKPNF